MRTACVLGVLLACAGAAWAEDESCLACHADRDALAKARTDPARPLGPLLLDRARYARSVHATRGCGECHFDYDRHPHPSDAETVACAECHEDAGKTLEAGVHGSGHATCGSCHGVHDVLEASARDSRLHPLNVTRTCGACHFDVDAATATPEELLRQRYSDDTHGVGTLRHGLVVSATCVSCHGGHDVRPSSDPASRVAPGNVDATCGACHVGILEQYAASVHHGAENGATCTHCHRPHDIRPPDGRFRQDSIETCGGCHAERFGTFRQTYHGKVSRLGESGRAATCASCHGAHDVRPASDPASRIHPSNLVATCGACHEGAHEEFTRYQVHADPTDGERYPGLHAVHVGMLGLLVGTFVLAGLHALLWFARSLVAKEWRRPPPVAGGRTIRRWTRLWTALHVGMMTSFLGLGVTGLPLYYSESGWALALMRFFGGPPAAGLVHRASAVLMGATIAAYLGNVAWRFLVKRERGLFLGPNSMVPRRKDFQDLAGNIKWFFGRGPKPRFDRWTYWEKFDFWAVFWGIAVIGGSGLVLWFPVAATRILPAWAINVATVVHGHEAILAIGFIFSIHVFHTHLRPDKFPMDLVFFTGRMSEEEFRHERPEEYARAVEDGSLEAMVAQPVRPGTRIGAYLLGSAALGVGFFLLAMMVAGLMA